MPAVRKFAEGPIVLGGQPPPIESIAPLAGPPSKAGPDREPWEVLCASERGVTMVGCSTAPMTDTADVQGGAFLMSRGKREFTSMVGGGA